MWVLFFIKQSVFLNNYGRIFYGLLLRNIQKTNKMLLFYSRSIIEVDSFKFVHDKNIYLTESQTCVIIFRLKEIAYNMDNINLVCLR
jgi:hypothetical protein